MRIRLSVARILAAALIWGGLPALPAHAAGKKSGGALIITDDLVGASAGTVGASGGAFTLDGTLSPVAAGTGGIVVGPFTGNEAGYFTMMTTTPVTSSFLPVSSKTVTVQWAVSNPTGTLYTIDASTAPDFTGAIFSTAIYNSSYATCGSLSPNITYYLRYKANYMEGDETAFHSLGSTRTASNVPAGCDFGFNVKQDGSADFTAISPALAALPTSLAGNACVVIRDTQTYIEQVTISGFTNNGFSLKVMSDPSFISSAPAVSPPALSTAAFRILNAGVGILHIDVLPTNSMGYGVLASSANIVISSVSVQDGFGRINVAGISIVSGSTISYSTVAVSAAGNLVTGIILNGSGNVVAYGSASVVGPNAKGMRLLGASSNIIANGVFAASGGALAGLSVEGASSFNSVSKTTMTCAGGPSLQLSGGSSNTITQSYMYSPSHGVWMDAGGYNAITLSTVVSGASGLTGAIWLNGVNYNTLTGDFISAPNTNAVYLQGGASNTISLSTMTSSCAGCIALYLLSSSSNSIAQSYMTNPVGYGARLDSNANYNGISQSTITSDAAGFSALYITASSSNTVLSSYIQGSTAALISGSTGTVISMSVLVATNTIGSALALQGAGGGLTLAGSTLSGGPSGRGLLLDVGRIGVVSIGSVTVTGSARGLEISTQAAGFVLAVDSITFRGLTPGATAIHFLGGTFSSTFTLANFEDSSVGANVSGAALDPASRITMFAHYGARTGSTYENDPASLVFWEAGPYPGCVVTNNVGAGQTYGAIQAAINALPTTLTGRSCVVIRDAATYNEQVTVRNFINNGSSITILGDPALSARPAVVPALGGFAIFNIANASVVVAGIRVSPTVAVQYGIYVSSPYVTISSVSVLDSMSMISGAGIAVSSWTTVSCASVTVTQIGASAFLLPGSTMSTVSYSSAANNSGTKPAVLLSGASTNTLTGMLATNSSGGGAVRIEYGGYNTVDRGSFTASGAAIGLHLFSSSFNAVAGSYMASQSGPGAKLESAGVNTISQSTMASNSATGYALLVFSSSSNTVTGSFISNPAGSAARLESDANNNTISQSTMTSGGAGYSALYLLSSSSNSIAKSYMTNPVGYGAWLDFNASYNKISQSTMTSSGAAVIALWLSGASSNTITQSFVANPAGDGAYIDANSNNNTISQSTMTSNAAGVAALFINNSGSNTVTGSYISNSLGYGARLTNNSNYNTIGQSAIANNSAAYSALYLWSSATNTFTQSLVSNGTGNGVFLDVGANWNSIQQSTVKGGADGVKAQSISGLNIALSTVTGGSGAAGAGVWVSSQTEYLTLSNSYVQGSTAVYLNASSRTIVNASLLAATGADGSGVWMTGNSLTLSMSSNTVLGGGAAGIRIDSNSGGLIRLSTNTIIARGAIYAVAAAGLSPAAAVWITSNTILPSLSASATTYGVYLEALPGGATVSNNGIFYRTSGAAFGGAGAGAYGLYASGSSGVKIDHNRISNPSMVISGSYIGAGLSATPGAIFKFNDLHSTGGTLTTFNLLRIDGSPNAVVRNNILSSSMTTTAAIDNRLIVVDAPSQAGFSSDYNTFFSSNGVYQGIWGAGGVSLLANWIATTGRDANTLSSNPRWLNPDGEDFHPLSREGRWNGAAFVADAVDAPGTDRADPAEPVLAEVNPNGARANQGSYGQTAEASKTVLPCPVTLYVRQAGGGDATTISGAIASLPNPIVGGHSCVVIGDSAVYNEQVTVQGFTNNGSSITIMLDPSLTAHPIVRGGFVIRNASVNVVGIDVATTSLPGLNYGIFASSANVNLSSVNVRDPGGFIFVAGVALSSYSSLSYSSISVQGAHGLRLDGKSASVVNSTMTSNSSGFYALYIVGAGSNAVTGSFVQNAFGGGAFIAGSNYNAVTFSTMVSNAGPYIGLQFSGAKFNTVANSYIGSSLSSGAYLNAGSDYNTISLSTIASNGGGDALYMISSASNTVAGSYISNPSGNAATLNAGSDYNTISLSTITSNGVGFSALNLNGARFNTVTGSYLSNPAGYGAYLNTGSSYNTISQSTMTSDSGYAALYIFNTSSNTVTGSYISNPFGYGAYINAGADFNAISLSTMKNNAAAYYALIINASNSSIVTQSRISNPSGTGAYITAGSAYNTVSQSTMTSDAAGFSALAIFGASSNTILSSYIQGSTAAIISGSTGTVINASVLVATGAAGSALAMQGGARGLALSSNTIIAGTQGAGLYLDGHSAGAITVSTNTIYGGRYGVFVATQQAATTLWITSNTIVPGYSLSFITYGLRLNGLTTGATIQNNGIYYRSPGATGAFYAGALDANSSAGLVITGNRFSNPGMITGNALGIALTGTPNTVFKFNDVHSTGVAISSAYHMRLTNSPGAQLRDNVFSSSWSVVSSTAALFVDAASQAGFVSDYNSFFSSNSFNSIEWGIAGLPFPWTATTGQDANSLAKHPRWMNPSAGVEDFHQLSQAGRWNGAAFVNDGYTSALLDAADPAEPFANESAPNGGRANLGSYGNTADASRSPAPPTSPAVAGVFASSISVSYGLAGADGYLTVASTAANFSGTQFASSTANGALALLAPQGLALNTTYFLRAGAVWGDYVAFNGAAPATATLANPPGVANPAFTSITPSSLDVAWTANGNPITVTTFSVVLSTGASFPNTFAGNQTFSTATLSYTATRTGLAQNTTYFAFIAALNWNAMPSAYAALGSTPTLAAVPLTAASTFSAVGSSSFTVSWSANGNPLAITTYTVSLSTASDFNAFATSVTFSTAPAFGTSATLTGLDANALYYFRVRALNHQGIGTVYAVLGSTLTRPVTLTAPAIAGLTAVNTSSITATWGLSALATGYNLVASLTNDPTAVFASSAPVGINATIATVFAPPLNPNTTYYLFVSALGPGAVTAFSAYPATATKADVPLTAASTFSAVGLTSMTVSWLPGGNPVGVTTYTVVLSTGASFPNAFAGNRTLSTAPAGAAPAASLAGLNDNTLYYLYVAGVNHNGLTGGFSALGSTVTLISAPTTVVFDEISSNTITASAYAPTPLFANLGIGLSGTQMARNGAYQAVHGEQWASTTSLPALRREAGAAGFSGKVYVFGGFNGAAALNTASVYDPATAAWAALPALSSARGGLAGATAGGRIYALGGTPDGATSLSVNQEYDPVTNVWTTKTPLSAGSDHLSADGAGGALYAFGGVNTGVDDQKTAQYDPTANAWTNRPAFPAARHQTAAAVAAGPAAGLIIASGGSGPANGTYAYDTTADIWSVKTAMPAAVAEAAAASLGGKIYVIGGAPAASTVYEYDPTANLWAVRSNMITGRAGLSAVAAGGRIYALGGSADAGATSLGVNEQYDPGVAAQFIGLTPNTMALFKARARSQTGTLSPETAVVSTWTWAALPTAVAPAFAVVEADSVTVSWALNGNPGATEFKARASTAASYGGGAAVLASDWGAMTSTATLGLSPNTTYFFSVQARNGIGGVPGITTAFVPLGSTATLAAVPALAPTPFPAAATNGVTVSWLPNGNPLSVTTYTVVVSTDAVYPNAHAGNVTVASTQPAGGLPTASLTGLVANTTYFAFASAVNWNGLRTAYIALGSTATLTLPPAAASPAFAAVHQSSATLSWLPNGNPVNVTTYNVILSTGGAFNAFAGNVGFSTTPAGALPTATAAAGLIPNTTYFGYAAAINWNGAVSAYASLGSTATLAVEPATAVTTFTAVQISSLTVSWSAAGNPLSITTYTVQLSTAADFNAFAASVTFTTAPASGPSATFTGLTDYTQYFFRVRAVNHGGGATAFVNLGSTTTVIAPLGVPALAGFPSVDITSITATWGLVTGATGYTLIASTWPANPPTVIAASSTTMSIAATTAAALAPPLSPNTTYFLFVRANGPLRSSLYAAYGAASTMAGPPATAVSTFTGVGITSFTVNWNANGNALAITTYTVQLSTAPDFNAFATSVTFTTVPVFGTSAMLTGLSGNTSYYLRIRALNHNGVPSAFVSLGSTLTVASPLFPTVMNSQTGDAVWRRANTALYSVAFLDTSGAHLDKFQVKASTTAGGLGTDIAPLTDVVIGLNPADSYGTPWALPASVFNSLLEGVTNYITVKVFNGPPLNNFTVLQDAFYVKKDTTSPVIVNTQTGDGVARSLPGTTYAVGVRDPSSGLASFQYSASLAPGTANAAVIAWTDIAVVANTTSYNTPWPVNFAALVSGVTNYISVRSWDIAGATTTATDAFFVHKDTTGPAVAIAAPQNSSFNSSLAQISGTAASIYGVKGTEVSVLDVLSGFYWNPASVAFNSAAPIMMPAAGTTAWTLSPGITWVNGATYRAVARSSTTANLYSTTYATATFVMDLSAPTVGVLAPAPNSTVAVLPQISGTAADPAPNPSGLSSVEVRLRRNADGLWWNWFTQAWGPTAVSSVTAGTAAWSLSPTPELKASLAHGASCFIAVRASDNALPANQGDFFVSGATFTWQDVTPPSAVTNLAASQGSLPGRINLTWTAPGDDAAVGLIALGEYRVFYSTDIAAAASTSAAQVVITTAGVYPGAAQAYTLIGLNPSATYYVRLALADSDVNWSSFSNQASTAAAPSPVNAITGHVLDISTQGITAVQVDCWNAAGALAGTTFTLADGSGTYTVNGLPAGNYKLRVTWTVNGFSSSLWQDGITMGSSSVDFFLNINYALATLTGTLGTLTASSFGKGGLGTASVADSFIELYQKGQKVATTGVQPTGRWSIPGLLPGAYSVRAFTGLGYTPFQDVVLTEGEVRVLGFVFDPLPAASVFAFPNPARTGTTIRFETALAPLQAGIFIFDLAGNLVKEISDSQISRAAAPTYRAAWDLNNSSGRPVAPGVYHVMVKVKGGSDDQTAKVIKKLAVVR